MVDCILILTFAADRARVQRLPRVLLATTRRLPVRAHGHRAVHQGLIELVLLVPRVGGRAAGREVLLPLGVLLGHQTHRQLAYVD